MLRTTNEISHTRDLCWGIWASRKGKTSKDTIPLPLSSPSHFHRPLTYLAVHSCVSFLSQSPHPHGVTGQPNTDISLPQYSISSSHTSPGPGPHNTHSLPQPSWQHMTSSSASSQEPVWQKFLDLEQLPSHRHSMLSSGKRESDHLREPHWD